MVEDPRLSRIESKLDSTHALLTDVRIKLGALDAYDIPEVVNKTHENESSIKRIDTQIKTYTGVAGFLGLIFGTFLIEGVKKWLS